MLDRLGTSDEEDTFEEETDNEDEVCLKLECGNELCTGVADAVIVKYEVLVKALIII